MSPAPEIPLPAAHRLGRPSPLLLHLSAALGAYQSGTVLAAMAGDPRFPWHEDLRSEAAEFKAAPPDALATAAEAIRRLSAFEAGIRAWQMHPWRRPASGAPVVWRSGAAELRDHAGGGGGGLPVLVIPSLINSPDILDLTPETSLLARLARQGLAPYLLDWGAPGQAEQSFHIEDYITARLMPAVSFLEGRTGRRPALLGYCMGGTMAAILAGMQPGGPGLVTLGAPWAFTGGTSLAATQRLAARRIGAARVREWLAALGATFGVIPPFVFDHLFAMIDPLQAARKFRRFAAMDMASPEAVRFVALEDWLADGRAMAPAAAKDLLCDWQIENALARGNWRCAGRPAAPERAACPALVVTGTRDHIAPPEAANPLATRIPGAAHLPVPFGHVGMIVSAGAKERVAARIAEFLSGLAQ